MLLVPMSLPHVDGCCPRHHMIFVCSFNFNCCGLRGWMSTTLSYRFVFLPTYHFFMWVFIRSRALEGLWLSLCFFRS